jgi:hypothetical protein
MAFSSGSFITENPYSVMLIAPPDSVGLFGKQALNAKSASKNIARTAVRQRVRDIDTSPSCKQRRHLLRQQHRACAASARETRKRGLLDFAWGEL